MSSEQTGSRRNHEVDGLRGWAALVVIFFHFFQETFGRLFPVLHDPIFGFLLNGHLMVLIFFVLSGDALSASFFTTDDLKTTARIALIRYFRLTFIIAISCGLSYILMKFGLIWNLAAAPLVHREDWLGIFLNFTPRFGDVVRYMLEGVYFHHEVNSSYNPFLWTMSIELLGSLLVFVNLLILSRVRERFQIWILFIQFCFLWFFAEYYSLFIFGMILCKFRAGNIFTRLRNYRWNIVFFIVQIGISFWIFPYGQSKLFSIADYLTFHQVPHESYLFLWASVIVFLVYSSRHLIWFFGIAPSRFLGKISFPLYAIQFNILVSITSLGILWSSNKGFLNSPYVLLIPLGSVLATVLLATGIEFFENIFLSAMRKFINQRVLKD